MDLKIANHLDITTDSTANAVTVTLPVIEQVERIRVEVRQYLDEPSVYTRMESLPENAETMMAMFESFGQFFVDGDLGTCNQSSSVRAWTDKYKMCTRLGIFTMRYLR